VGWARQQDLTVNSLQIDKAVSRAGRLVSMYDRNMLSEASLVSELADLATPETLPVVLETLPSKVLALVHHWAKSLPEEDRSAEALWPIRREIRLSFKEWLRAQEEHENGIDRS
jgi:hypothetical protein